MRRKVRINPKTHLVCIPAESIEDGIVGNVDAYSDAVTFTLISPQATLKDIKNSLETVLRDVNQRIGLQERNNQKEIGSHERNS